VTQLKGLPCNLFRAVFWGVLPCKMIGDRRFRGATCHNHQGTKIILHGRTTQKTALNIILAAVRTWNLTYPVIWLDGQRNTKKILCQYSRSPGQDFISRPGPAELKYTANLATAGIPLDHRETPVRLSFDTKSCAYIYKTICLRHVLCFTLHRF
jgi:hypothetical protein